MEEPDAPVFVIDLASSPGADESGADDAATEPIEPIALVAIVDEHGEILLRPITPTCDLRLLNAVARLVRFAHLHGLSVRLVAERYGSEYERRLLFEQRLPSWALDWGQAPDRH